MISSFRRGRPRRGDAYRVFRPDAGIPILFHHSAKQKKLLQQGWIQIWAILPKDSGSSSAELVNAAIKRFSSSICRLAHSPAFLEFHFSFTTKSQTSYKVCSCRPVALTVRASDSKSEGWGFESLLACQGNQWVSRKAVCPFEVCVLSINSWRNDFWPSLCLIPKMPPFRLGNCECLIR
jgi:hypothetical protein